VFEIVSIDTRQEKTSNDNVDISHQRCRLLFESATRHTAHVHTAENYDKIGRVVSDFPSYGAKTRSRTIY